MTAVPFCYFTMFYNERITMLIERRLPEVKVQHGQKSMTAHVVEIMAAGATQGISYKPRDLCWIVEREMGIGNPAGSLGNALQRLETAGFVIERTYMDVPGLPPAARPVQYTITSVDSIPVEEFDTNLKVWPIPKIPDDYTPSADAAPRKKYKKKAPSGVLVPPLGAQLQVTEAHMNGKGIIVTLGTEWTGHVDQDAVIVGSEVQVLGAGIGSDGVWVQTNDFTMTMRGK